MNREERIKELEKAAMQLFDMVHDGENLQGKIKANLLYHIIVNKAHVKHEAMELLKKQSDWLMMNTTASIFIHQYYSKSVY